MRTVLLLSALLALGACSVDDSILEGKSCNILSGDTDCIQGYKCVCTNCPKGTTCCCSKNAALQPGTFPLLESEAPSCGPAEAASLRLLRQQGVVQSRPSRER
jgi:hypothetical protein